MIVMRKLVLVLLLLPLLATGQVDTGMHFESGLSWKEVLAKAKIEKKFIFVDCFATWCGPCVWMNQNIFPQKQVGDFMNDRFISVAVQMNKTSNDNQSVKDWYAVADSLHRELKILSYPTYIFMSPEGEVVHKMVGSIDDAQTFIAKSGEALDPKKQYLSLLQNWKIHKDDSLFLFNALSAAASIGSLETSLIEDDYIDLLGNPCTMQNIGLFDQLGIQTSSEKVFKLYLENLALIDKTMGGQHVELTLCPIIFKEGTEKIFNRKHGPVYWNEIAGCLRNYPQLEANGDQLPIFENLFKQKIGEEINEYLNRQLNLPINWANALERFKNRFRGYDIGLIFLQVKLNYCARKHLPHEQSAAALAIMKQYGNIIGDWDMNDVIWSNIFNVTSDRKILSEAEQWMRQSVARRTNLASFDTYANLLYKIGYLKDAVIWETKTIDLAIRNNDIDDASEFKLHLEKMTKRQRTWEDSSPIPRAILQ